MSRSRRRLSLALAAWAALAGHALAAQIPCDAVEVASHAGEALQLEVFRNGEATGLIAAFRQDRGGHVSSTPSELKAVGLVAPADCPAILLDDLPGVTYRYDEDRQQIFISARPQAIIPLLISLRGKTERSPATHDAGAVLNYSLTASGGNLGGSGRRWRPDGVSGAFEARAFGRFGLATTAFTAQARKGPTGPGQVRAVRLDSTWTGADANAAVGWSAGDLISGGFAWTRPVRLGGFQIRRDFATRPDIVTTPTPVLSASAAAPSTLDVMLGSSVVMSRQVSAGPIRVSDLPVLQGGGEARLVLRDAAGRQQVVSAAYFATPQLLSPGMLDFSAEGGFARRNFGQASNDYDPRPVGSGSVRYGLTDALTLQGHVEGGAGLANGGAGLVARVGGVGAASVAATASTFRGQAAALFAAAFDSRFAGITLSAQAQRTTGPYRDLAAISAGDRWTFQGQDLSAPPKSTLQIAASTPLRLAIFERWGDLPGVAVSYSRVETRGTPVRDILSASFRYMFARKVTAQAQVYAIRTQHNDHGAFVAVSLPLGGDLEGSSGVETASGRTGAFVEVRKQEHLEPGATAWRLRAVTGDGAEFVADGAYRSPIGRISADATYQKGRVTTDAGLDGALVWLGGPRISPDRLNGAFVVVDVGAPGVTVRQQHRMIGITGRSGQLLVPDLNPYETNRIDIDLENIPLDLAAPRAFATVTPPAGAGALVRFGVAKAPTEAMVTLTRPDGRVVPPGAVARFEGAAADASVGYDGVVFLSGLKADNQIKVVLGGGESCTASLAIDLAAKATIHVARAVCR